ncbi:hypothetical protein ScalyP_jg2818 [Parmales sp. scaly parma]|nr:hypothetical protein ScalyP_jg2818 [Parmales sp. scaly parma]
MIVVAIPPPVSENPLLGYSPAYCLLLLNLPKPPPPQQQQQQLPPVKITLNGNHPIIPSPKFTGITFTSKHADAIFLVGFKFFSPNSGSGGVSHGMFLRVPSTPATHTSYTVRSFDPITEEMSDSPFGRMDETAARELISSLTFVNNNNSSIPHITGEHVDEAVEILGGLAEISKVLSVQQQDLMEYITDEVLVRCNVAIGGKVIPIVSDINIGPSIPLDTNTMTDAPPQSQLPPPPPPPIVDGNSLSYPNMIPLSIPAYRSFSKSSSSQIQPQSKLPKSTLSYLKSLDSSPSDRSKLALDSLFLFRSVLTNVFDDSNYDLFLGELDLSFLTFLSLECWGSFDRWKSLVVLAARALFESSEADNRNSVHNEKEQTFFELFGKVLTKQLAHVDEDFFSFFDQPFGGDQDEEAEISSNFLLTTLEWAAIGLQALHLGETSLELCNFVRGKFGVTLTANANVNVNAEKDNDMDDGDGDGDDGYDDDGYNDEPSKKKAFHLFSLMSDINTLGTTDDENLPTLVNPTSPFDLLSNGGRTRSESNVSDSEHMSRSRSNSIASYGSPETEEMKKQNLEQNEQNLKKNLNESARVLQVKYKRLFRELEKSKGREDVHMICSRLMDDDETSAELLVEVEEFLLELE